MGVIDDIDMGFDGLEGLMITKMIHKVWYGKDLIKCKFIKELC